MAISKIKLPLLQNKGGVWLKCKLLSETSIIYVANLFALFQLDIEYSFCSLKNQTLMSCHQLLN